MSNTGHDKKTNTDYRENMLDVIITSCQPPLSKKGYKIKLLILPPDLFRHRLKLLACQQLRVVNDQHIIAATVL